VCLGIKTKPGDFAGDFLTLKAENIKTGLKGCKAFIHNG